MLILDTDMLTMVQRKSGEAYYRLNDRLEEASSSHGIFVSIVSFEEQTRGWLSYMSRSGMGEGQIAGYTSLHRLLRDYSTRKVLDFDESAFQKFQDLRAQRIRIGTMDLRIAAIALAHDATLLSRNLSDFRKVPGLRVEDWTVEE